MLRPIRSQAAAEVLANARRSAYKRDEFNQGGFNFIAIWDHILESQCGHSEGDTKDCSRCLFESSLGLPELPEMVFPHNALTVSFSNLPGCSISFNALDALRLVCADRLPDVQVAPSAMWQSSRSGIIEGNQSSHPFDWTYSTDYAGTLYGCKAEPTNERIDIERLKRREPIKFYSQVTLYEDELADHGSVQMSVRVRVMPTFFFVLMRFYLRVDRVLIRVCDTRVVGNNDECYMLREWTRREAKVTDLAHLPADMLVDVNQIWASLPIIEIKNQKLIPNV